MRREFLPFSPPNISEEEIAEVADTLRSDWITTGPKTKRFEAAFAQYLGAPDALGLNSCTAGLHTALVALGVGLGDEVITTPMTFAASVNVIEHVGARPVLADVEPTTLNIDPAKVDAALSPRTKAIIVVHFAGHPARMDEIDGAAAPRNIHVIEDAAHALPARYKGQLVGGSTRPTAFSFYATKNLTTGEGGMLTGSPSFLDRCRVLSLHGMSRDAWNRYERSGNWFYEIVHPGFKYNMTDIQASLGLVQLRRLEQFQAARRRVVEAYRSAFADEPALELPTEDEAVSHAWHLFVLRLRLEALSIDRDKFIEAMRERNIGTSVHFIPIHIHPFYRDKYGYKPSDFPVAFGNYQRSVSLPLNPRMSAQDTADVIEAISDIVKTFRR